jgi:hypothetical protein
MIEEYFVQLEGIIKILIYPQDLTKGFDGKPDAIRTRSLTFALDDDLDQCGQLFLANIHND